MNAKLRSLLATIVLVAALVVLVQRHLLFSPHPLAIALQVAAALLMIWARITFGRRSFHPTANPTAGGLVTSGPYRYWRHPIYAAVLLFLWTAAVAHQPSALALSLVLVATAATAVRMQAEEQFLRATYPEYAAYAARTRRVIPGVL